MTTAPFPSASDLLNDDAFTALLAACMTELGGPVTAQREARKAIEQATYELTVLHKSTHFDGRRDEDFWQRAVLQQEAARGRAVEAAQRAADEIAGIEAKIADLREQRYAAMHARFDKDDFAARLDAQRGLYQGAWVR